MSDGTLILSARDVKSLLTMEDCIATQEEVFALHAQGKTWSGRNAWIHPDGKIQTYPAQGKMMTGGIEPDWWGAKKAFYGEYDPAGRRRVQILEIFETTTLRPVSIMDCMYIGNVRTGAAAAVATKYLARKDARIIGVLGSGATAWFSLLAHRAIDWPASTVYVYSRSERRHSFAREMQTRTGYQVVPLEDPEAVVRQADILITGAATRAPILEACWVQPGTHVNAMGEKYEIDPKLCGLAKNVADEVDTAVRDGKLSVAIGSRMVTADAVWASLGELVAGMKPGRTSDEEITLFDSSGLCVQDLAAGLHVWKRALEKRVGQIVQFCHDEPLW